MEALQSLHMTWENTGEHFLRLGGAVIGLAFLALVGNFLYHVYINPLKEYPGPILWAGSRLPTYWYGTRGSLVYKIQELHEKYGPVVRVAPTELSYTTAAAWKDIYGHRRVEMSKASDGRGGILPPPQGGHSIITANREDHSRLRRNLAHAFSEKALRDQESYIQTYVDYLVDGLRKVAAPGGPVNFVSWYNFTTFDVIGDLAFGEPFDCLRNNEYHSWITNIFNGVQAAPWIHFAIYYQISKKLWKYMMPKAMIEARVRNWRYSAEKMDRRMANTDDRKDFTSYMLRHKDEKGLTDQELRNMSTILIIAGSETTATLLSGATYHMLNNRHVYERLAKEVRDRFQREEDITITTASELKYMLAVLEESLRMYPPVPNTLPRTVPAGGDIIDGKWVPENTAVGIPQYCTFRSETNFYKPNEFIPERWLSEAEGGSAEFANDNKAAFQPFSFGPRNCIGRNLAYAEMRIIMARLLFNFDLALDQEQSRDWDHQKAPLLWLKNPLMVHVTERATA